MMLLMIVVSLLSSKRNCVTLLTHKSHANVFISTFSSLLSENRGFKNSAKNNNNSSEIYQTGIAREGRSRDLFQHRAMRALLTKMLWSSSSEEKESDVSEEPHFTFLTAFSVADRYAEEQGEDGESECICKELEPINHKNVILLM